MRQYFSLCVIFILLSLYAFADVVEEGGGIRGTIVNTKTGQPVEFVTVGIWKQGEEVPFTGTITDQTGEFYIGGLDKSEYIIRITYLGYETVERRVTISDDKTINLRKIEIAETAMEIEGAEIVAQASQMRFEIDKKVFNVDQNIASAGGSASEVLSNIPSVEVDNEGEISLRGSSNVTIWINGKAQGLTSDNQAQILEQLPAESIDRIEVITNPSAKYSPEGTSGIINIILKQDRKAGYYGSVQAGLDSHLGYNASANINYNKGKWEAYANVGYRHRVGKGEEYTYRTNLDENGLGQSMSLQDANSKNLGNGMHLRAGLTYRPTQKDYIYLDVFGMYGAGERETINDYRNGIPLPGQYTTSQRIATSENNNRGGNVMLSYRHEFSQNSKLDASASINAWRMKGISDYYQTTFIDSINHYSSYQGQTSNINNNSAEFQVDYVNNFNKNSKLEAGYKGSLGREKSPVETFSGLTSETAIFDPVLYNKFIYNLDVHALYATYSGRINKFGYNVGLRGEYTGINTKSLKHGEIEEDIKFFHNEYYSLFPSVFLTYELPKGHEVQVNYTRRISRPRGHQLNSFINISDSANISFGNPLLEPQFSNSFELNYIKSWSKHTISFSGWYRDVNNVMQRIRYRDEEVMKSTFVNISGMQSAGVELVAKNEFFTFFNLTSTVNLFYQKLEGFTYIAQGIEDPIIGEESKGFTWNARLIANFVFPHAMSLQITGNYNSPRIVAQGTQEANYALDAGFRKSFFDRKLSVAVNARDILNSRKWHTNTFGEGFVQEYSSWRNGRTFSLTVTYAFGNMHPTKKATRQVDTSTGYEEEI
ncbi:TonB-dependent receptor [Bacteroidales bacterium OttesenSCG-928-K22]|nr:TonB-dependent receptor [Bacteroidales bacterium OttesenSCG-928-K22]